MSADRLAVVGFLLVCAAIAAVSLVLYGLEVAVGWLRCKRGRHTWCLESWQARGGTVVEWWCCTRCGARQRRVK